LRHTSSLSSAPAKYLNYRRRELAEDNASKQQEPNPRNR
jgi:hypothetical protein